MSDPAIWLAFLAAVCTCYVGACNIALKAYSRSRLSDLLSERGREHRIQQFNERRGQLILSTGTIRVFLNMSILLLVLLHIERTYPSLPQWGQFLTAFLIAGVVVSIFGVAIPVFWAVYQAEKLIAHTMPVMNVMVILFSPVTWFLSLFDPVVRRVSGADEQGNGDSELGDEVLSVVEEHDGGGRVDEVQKEMLEAVFEFKSTTAGEIMTPRTDVVGIEVSTSLEAVRDIIIEQGYSRYPVYEETLDRIVGVLYAKDLLRFIKAAHSTETHEPFDIRKVLREALLVPESKPLDQLLAEFKLKKVHIAILLDEYGGTAGIITVEDIVEEIVGDIADEFDEEEANPDIQHVDDRTVVVDARVYVDDLNDALNLELPEDEDYDTVGGFVFATLGHIPEKGESFQFGAVTLTVIDVERTKINTVRLDLPAPENASSDAA